MFAVKYLVFFLIYASVGIFKSLFGYETNAKYITKDEKLNFYWNVPSFQCRSHKINFTVLTEKYGIIANADSSFYGENVVILYDPGFFPALLEDKTTHQLVRRNGGVPQAGNLTLHLEKFRMKVDERIPDKDFSGVGIIDFESWRPIFRQHWGRLLPYKELTKDLIKQEHPFWSNAMIEKEAKLVFERWARIFMLESLLYVKELRPKAKWGYYHYPYCFNMSPKNMHTSCSKDTQKENERIEWLFGNSDILYPSVYMSETSLTPKQRMQMIEGRVQEAFRMTEYSLRGPYGPKVMPYYWYKYHDTDNFVSKEDLYNSMLLMKNLKVDGIILWGASWDVSSRAKCEKLYEYVDNVLGPFIANI